MARISFMGSKTAGLRALRSLLQRLPPGHQFVGALCPTDDVDVRSELPAFQAFCSAQGVSLIVARNQRDAEATLREWQPDVVLVLGWYYLIRLELFPSIRFFAFHYSRLPNYRGNAPIVWQILRGEHQIGCTLFQLAPGFDQGDFVDRGTVPLGPDETVADALERLNDSAVAMLEAHLPALLDGTVVLHPQEHELATYGGLRTPEDGHLDWSRPAPELHNFIRAQTRPYPGAFTVMPDGRVVRVWRAQLDPRTWYAVPGAVVERSPGRVVVACGSGALVLLETQVDGAPPAPCETIFGSLRLRLS